MDFTLKPRHSESMSRASALAKAFSLVLALTASSFGATVEAQGRIHEFDTDLSASALIPVSWAADSPTLRHTGLDALLGLEYDSPIALQFRLEAGYLWASPSTISPNGELYRGWEGLRIAFLAGYAFAPYRLGMIGLVEPSLLAGGALTSADYLGTALAYAYPSLVLEPRAFLRLRTPKGSDILQGPWLALPVELMFRGGGYTLAPGLSLGWRYRLEAAR